MKINLINRSLFKVKRPSLLAIWFPRKQVGYFIALLAAFLVLLLLNKGVTGSGNLVPVNVWQDRGGQTSFEQLIILEQQRAQTLVNNGEAESLFQRKADRGFSGGYTSDAFWFKFNLPATDQPKTIYLEVQPTYLDSVILYWPDAQGQYAEMPLGDQLPFSQRFVHSRGFVFPVEQGIEARTGYIRLQTTSTSMMLLTAWQPDAFYQRKQHEYFVLALMLGIGISLIIFNSVQIFDQKGLMYSAFMFFLVVQVLAIFVINGLASEFVFPDYPAIDSAMVGLVTMLLLVTISLGHYFFLRLSWQETPLLFSLTWGGVGLALLGMLGVWLGYYVKIMPLLGIYVIVLYVSWVVFGLKRVRQKQAYAHWVVFASVSGIFSSVAIILVLLGWLSVEHVGLYAYQVGSIVAIFAFQMMISGHINDSMRQNKKLVIEKVTQRKLLQQEQAIQRKQSQFIAMLTHEIKTPLSVIQIALSQLSHKLQPHALTAARDIVDILDRCLISERLEASAMEPQLVQVNLQQWLQAFLGYVNYSDDRLQVHIDECNNTQIMADPLYLRIVFANLIENALKYSPAESQVHLRLSQKLSQDQAPHIDKTSQLVVSISNTIGKVGLPDASRLFEKYYRAQGAHRISGSGIGLYLVHELVQAMHVKIVYQHTETDVSFTLYFPLISD